MSTVGDIVSIRNLRRWFLIVLIALVACDGEGASPVPATESPEPMAQEVREDPLLTFGEKHAGKSTYYQADGTGNCSFDADGDLMVGAINTRDYANAAMCGAHLAVSGPEGSVIVRITDRCPGCRKGGLDLSREAFAQIAGMGAGRVPVTWQIIAAPVSGPIAYRYKESSSRYWLAIQIRNHKWPVATLEIKPQGAADWIRVERRAWNYFVHAKPISAGPLRVRVTAVTGAMVEDELPEPEGGRLVQGSAQF